MKQFFKKNWLIMIIFLFTFFLRFWSVPELFYFGIDEEYHSLLALSQIKDLHPIWIGLSAGKTGYYIGPGLVYLHALLLWIGKLDPVILAYAASVVGITTLIVFYFVAENLLGKKTAIVSTAFYAFLPFVLQYDRRFWNSTLVPLISLLIFFCLVKSFKDARWHVALAFLIGLSFHIHASLLIYVPIYFIVLIYQYIKIRRINFSLLFISLLIFLILYSPLIVYDFVHNFDNLKTPLRLLQHKELGAKFNNYYFLGFIPLISLWLGKYLVKLNRGILIFLLIFYIFNAFLTVTRWSTNSGLSTKKELIRNTIGKIGNKSFRLETTEKYLYFGGWRYLFEAYGKKPDSSQADEMFGWIYPREISPKKPDLKVIITSDPRSRGYKAII